VRFRGARRDKLECAASECKLIARDFWKRGFDRWVLVPYVRTTYVQDLYNQEDLEDLTRRASERWRSPPPSIKPLPTGGKPPLGTNSNSSNTDMSGDNEEPANERMMRDGGNSTTLVSVKHTWAYPSTTPVEQPTTPFDSFSFPSFFSPLESESESEQLEPEPERLGEELDLIDWDRTSGPETVVCWPYHRIGNVDWWWTRVVERVKRPLSHLRRR